MARTSRKEKIEKYATNNRESAVIILANIERYGGPGAVLVQWARMVLSMNAGTKTPAGWRLVA